jgi:hypothetical protein
LRYGYGETGKQPPVYATVSTLTTGQGFLGSGFGDVLNAGQSGQGGLINSFQLGNNALKPERSIEREYGIDLGFLDQRATLGVTYYNKRTGDAILRVPVSPSATGSGQALRNAASISNKGLEVELNTVPLRSQNYEWNLGLQYGRNRNKVESLAGAQFITFNTEGFTGAIGSATVGFPVGTIRGSDFARCGRSLTVEGVGDIDALCGANAPKDALFLDEDGLPVLDPTDRVIGVTQPDFTGGAQQLAAGREVHRDHHDGLAPRRPGVERHARHPLLLRHAPGHRGPHAAGWVRHQLADEGVPAGRRPGRRRRRVRDGGRLAGLVAG